VSTPTRSPGSVTPPSGALGVRIDGVDIAADSSEALAEMLQAILDEHLVIHLPGQVALTPEQHLAFAALWGEIATHPYVPSIDGHPGIMQISDPTELTTVWHQDVTHMERPPSVSSSPAGTGGRSATC